MSKNNIYIPLPNGTNIEGGAVFPYLELFSEYVD
jgi:hypothetical protein